MSYKIVFLASAEQDMNELKSYVTKNFSPDTWQDTYSRLKDSIRNLKTFPFVGSIPGELERLNLTQYCNGLVQTDRLRDPPCCPAIEMLNYGLCRNIAKPEF